MYMDIYIYIYIPYVCVPLHNYNLPAAQCHVTRQMYNVACFQLFEAQLQEQVLLPQIFCQILSKTSRRVPKFLARKGEVSKDPDAKGLAGSAEGI